MKKFFLMLLAFFSTFFSNFVGSNNKLVTVHGMKVRKGSGEALILASTHELSAPRPSSMKEFQVGEDRVWALNAKNAVRKAKNAGNTGDHGVLMVTLIG